MLPILRPVPQRHFAFAAVHGAGGSQIILTAAVYVQLILNLAPFRVVVSSSKFIVGARDAKKLGSSYFPSRFKA